MLVAGKALCAIAAAWACALACSVAQAAAPSPQAVADFAGHPASTDVRYVAQWVVQAGDNRGAPFAIVDKKDAKLFVFGADGRLAGATPALLGLARGDQGTPGVGALVPSRIPPAQRTTPAGRFASEPGRNLGGEDVVWFDYDAGLAIHRLRPAPARERRPQRLASPRPNDHRISLGCVVVAVDFYQAVVAATLGKQRGVVYVLPEEAPVRTMFGSAADL